MEFVTHCLPTTIFNVSQNLTATGRGIALMMLAVFAAVVYGMIIKKVATKYTTLTVVSVQNLIGAVYFVPLFFFLDFRDIKITSFTFEMFIPVVYLSVFASTLAYVGFIQGLRVLGVAKATIFTNFIPVFTAIFAFFILKDQITLAKIGGIGLVVVGLILSQATANFRKKKAEETIVDELY